MKSEITLPGAELKTALPGLNKIIGRRSSLPVLSHVKIARQKNGRVSLQGTDLDAHATYHLEAVQPGEPVELLMPLEQLNQAFKANCKQDLTLLVDGAATKLRYRLGGNPIEQPINTLPVEEWPPAPKLTGDGSPLSPGFGEALKQALACCSDSRPVLRGACLDASDQKNHYVVASNGQMLYAANSFTFPLTESVSIPDSKFLTGSGLLDADVCFLSVQAGKKKGEVKRINLHNQRWEFSTRELEGPFPEWKKNLVKLDDRWTRIQLKPEAVTSLLQIVPNLPGQDGNLNVVRLKADKVLTVEGRNKDDQEPTRVELKEVSITGKARDISLNREYLLNALRFGLDEVAILDEKSPLVFSKGGRQMVVMPVRTTDTVKPSAPNPQPPTNPERKTEMPRKASSQIPPAAPSAAPTTAPKPEPAKSPETSLLDQIEQVRESARNLVRDLNGLTDAVKQMEKDRRTNEKELENARAVLKKLQQVQI